MMIIHGVVVGDRHFCVKICHSLVFSRKICHFLKKLTKGRHLWLRNNGSTMISSLIDTICVISITHYLSRSIPLPEAESELKGLFLLISYAYIFKFIVALLDTPLLYIGVKHLKKYLGINDQDF